MVRRERPLLLIDVDLLRWARGDLAAAELPSTALVTELAVTELAGAGLWDRVRDFQIAIVRASADLASLPAQLQSAWAAVSDADRRERGGAYFVTSQAARQSVAEACGFSGVLTSEDGASAGRTTRGDQQQWERVIDAVLVKHGAALLRNGHVVAFPTETVYGLGADASQPAAVGQIFEIKGRPANHPLIVHLADAEQISAWAQPVSELAQVLAREFWPGPLTLILPKAPEVSAVVTGGQDSIGLRVPSHPLALQLLREFGGGVAAPSANRFGLVSPTTATHVRQDLGDDVELVIDGGACQVGIESTIVWLAGDSPMILRPGAITAEDLRRVVGREVPVRGSAAVRVSGQLASHYAPRAAVMLVPAHELDRRQLAWEAAGNRVAILSDDEIRPEALYASLRRADEQQVDLIVVCLPPEEGVGLAVADRLRKAAAPRGEGGS